MEVCGHGVGPLVSVDIHVGGVGWYGRHYSAGAHVIRRSGAHRSKVLRIHDGHTGTVYEAITIPIPSLERLVIGIVRLCNWYECLSLASQ